MEIVVVRDYRSKIDPLGDTDDIRRDGHAITRGVQRGLTVPKVEMTDGKLFNSHADRIHVLALLLESVGIDAAVRLGPPALWRQAVGELPDEKAVCPHTSPKETP